MYTLLIGVLLALVALASPAEAFPSSRLTYVREMGAEGCPAESTLRKAVSARLGYDPFFPAADKTIVVVIAPDHGDLRAKVFLVDPSGMVKGLREFTNAPRQCSDLVYAVALSISIAIDPTVADAPSPPRAAVSDEPLPAPRSSGVRALVPSAREPSEAPPAGDDPTRENVSKRTGLVGALGIGGVGSFGLGPDPSTGGLIFGSLRLDALSFTLEAAGDLPTVADGGRYRFWTLRMNAVPCVHWDPWLFCGIAAAGRAAAAGTNAGAPAEEGAFFLSSGVRAGFELPISNRVHLRVHVDGQANLVQMRVTWAGDELWKAPPFSASVGGALAVHFW